MVSRQATHVGSLPVILDMRKVNEKMGEVMKAIAIGYTNYKNSKKCTNTKEPEKRKNQVAKNEV